MNQEIPPHKTKTQTGRIPPDPLLIIWSHLPAQTLYRFRSVCHTWNNLISNDPLLPTLRHRLPYRSLSPPPPTLLLILRHFPSEPIKHPDRPVHVSTRPASGIILSSSSLSDIVTRPIRNGFTPYVDSSLYLLPNSTIFSPLCCFCSGEFFYVCNPSVNQFFRVLPSKNRPIQLPQGQIGHLDKEKLSSLSIDETVPILSQGQIGHLEKEKLGSLSNGTIDETVPIISPGQNRNFTSNGAFGYLHHENRFALVNITGTLAEVFEFGPGQAGSTNWRVISSPSPAPVRGFGLMVEGRFFWTAASGTAFVVCLDYKTETFSEISPPVGNAGEVMLYDQMYLVRFKGAVCAVDNFSRAPRMEIWVLHMNEVEEEGFYWVRKYNVYMTGMKGDLVYPFCDYYFYDESDCEDEAKKKEKNETIVLCNGTRSRLYCYNLKSRFIKQFYKPKQRSFEQVGLYTPGLFPLTIE